MNLLLRLVLLVSTITALCAGLARAEPAAKPSFKSVSDCVRHVPQRGRDRCIGVTSAPCVGPDEGSRTPADLIACDDREQKEWDELLNDAYRRLQKALDDEQRGKLRDMQRAWIESRDKTCRFYFDYFEGTMANPMIANCMNRETANRAIFLMGFADDAADRDSR